MTINKLAYPFECSALSDLFSFHLKSLFTSLTAGLKPINLPWGQTNQAILPWLISPINRAIIDSVTSQYIIIIAFERDTYRLVYSNVMQLEIVKDITLICINLLRHNSVSNVSFPGAIAILSIHLLLLC